MTGPPGAELSAETDVRVRLPPSWFEFDLWRAGRTGDLARMVDERVAEFPALGRYRAPMLKFLRQVAFDAERRGTVFAAAMVESDGDDLIVATALALVTSGPADESPPDVESIAAQLPAVAAGARWRRVDLVELAAGRCVRVYGVQEADLGDGQSSDCVVMHSLIPLADSGQVLDFVLVSPHVRLAEGLLDVFDAISGTLTWTTPPVRP